jgi:CubicO group peptidase (beta-lactamase class C family)
VAGTVAVLSTPMGADQGRRTAGHGGRERLRERVMRRWWLAAGVTTVALVGVACGDDGDDGAGAAGAAGATTTVAADGPTEATEDTGVTDVSGSGAWDWPVVEPAEAGMDAEVLDEARRFAFEEIEHTQGVVVVRGGAMVAEWYAPGADEESWAASWSVAKSVTSALVGIAIDEGLIESVDVPMVTFYPEWEGTPRQDITLADVLQMASGLDFVESYNPDDLASSDIIQLVLFQPDQLTYAAQRPLEVDPGTRFQYSSGDTLLLSGMLEQVTGMTTEEFATERLFEPLGIEPVEWWRDAEGNTLTYCCLDTTTRNFARFGQLYLDGGQWQGEQVVPAEWVAASVEPSPSADGYGYQWWLTGRDTDELPDDLYSARGHDGQYVYVIPSLDLVVVRNGTYAKHDGDPVADPNLYGFYPSGVVEGQGTEAPQPGWHDVTFLTPIIESIQQ